MLPGNVPPVVELSLADIFVIRALAGNNGKRICAFLTSVVDYARDRMDAQHCGREAIACGPRG